MTPADMREALLSLRGHLLQMVQYPERVYLDSDSINGGAVGGLLRTLDQCADAWEATGAPKDDA